MIDALNFKQWNSDVGSGRFILWSSQLGCSKVTNYMYVEQVMARLVSCYSSVVCCANDLKLWCCNWHSKSCKQQWNTHTAKSLIYFSMKALWTFYCNIMILPYYYYYPSSMQALSSSCCLAVFAASASIPKHSYSTCGFCVASVFFRKCRCSLNANMFSSSCCSKVETFAAVAMIRRRVSSSSCNLEASIRRCSSSSSFNWVLYAAASTFFLLLFFFLIL